MQEVRPFSAPLVKRTHWDDSGVVWQEVPGGNMTGLVLCASDIQRQLNWTLGAKVIAGAVLLNFVQYYYLFYFLQIYLNHTFQIKWRCKRLAVYPTNRIVILALEYCIFSTMSSLVSGISPENTWHVGTPKLKKYNMLISNQVRILKWYLSNNFLQKKRHHKTKKQWHHHDENHV